MEGYAVCDFLQSGAAAWKQVAEQLPDVVGEFSSRKALYPAEVFRDQVMQSFIARAEWQSERRRVEHESGGVGGEDRLATQHM
ncbi:hypothetical protein D9M68_815650 [compost metagenome]